MNGFDERDRELAELLATHVAAVLDNMETQSELRVERDKFAALFRNIPHAVGIGLFDDGNPVVSEVNPTFEETFGAATEDIRGENIDAHIVPDDSLDDAAQLNDRMRNGEEVSGAEVQRRAVDGTRDFLLHSVNIPRGDIEGIVVYTDITDLKRRERELERKNRRLEYVTSALSHDLRNPLEVSRNVLELASETDESDHLATAKRAHERMDALLDDVLTLARGGQAVQEPQQIDLRDVVAASWETVATADSTLVSETTRCLRGDPSRVKQLFENLFRNAVDHGGDSVTITVGDLPDENGFYVEDDGLGIPPADRGDVFDPGYTTTGDGTGFGLAIVNEIVDAHGWTISVTDGADTGTRFEVKGIEQPQTTPMQS